MRFIFSTQGKAKELHWKSDGKISAVQSDFTLFNVTTLNRTLFTDV